MADQTRDWRITEGPAFGIEPEFDLSDIHLGANFFVTGSMSRRITARLTTTTPTLVESLGRTLPQLGGSLRIVDNHPKSTALFLRDGKPVDLGPARGVLGLAGPDCYALQLYLPADQFAKLLPMFSHRPAAGRLRIEVERTLDQGLFEPDVHFWNDRLSPVILFNEFEFSFPDCEGGYP